MSKLAKLLQVVVNQLGHPPIALAGRTFAAKKPSDYLELLCDIRHTVLNNLSDCTNG